MLEPDGLTTEFYQTFQQLVARLLQLFLKEIETDRIFLNIFYVAAVTLTSKSEKYNTHTHTKYRPTFAMNSDIKIFVKNNGVKYFI